MPTSSINQRMIFENASARFMEAGYSLDQAVLTQSCIRSEQSLLTTVSEYRMRVLNNENNNTGTIFNTEIRLNLQDAFLVSEIGIFLAKPTSSTDSTFVLCNYPNAIIFSTAGTAAAGESLMTNGRFSITVNKRVYVPVWDIFRHRLVPQTQDGSAAAVIDQQDGSSDGFYPVEPNPILSGAADNDLRITLANAMSAVEANSRVVLIARGVLGQNVTSVKA